MSTVIQSDLHFSKQIGLFDRFARRIVTSSLAQVRKGEVTLLDAESSKSFGQSSELCGNIRVNNPRFFRKALLGGTLSVAESYINGDWDSSDLTQLFRIFARNRESADNLDGGFAQLAKQFQRIYHWWHDNTQAGSRKNIHAHYDLGNEFFSLWLDETMAYSCAIFPDSETSLSEASTEKFDRVCRRLALQPSDEVLEIGSGWGGFAIHAARNYGCHVTTTTISHEQFVVARRRINEAGLDNKITILEQDYRDLQGEFDKLVSIEMIEAVGHKYFDEYFRQCSRLLRPHGSFLLQAIVMPERGYDQYLHSVDFIQRYIVPGGCLPSLGTILSSVARVTDLRFSYANDYASHYAQTLRKWRTAFNHKLAEVRQLGYSEQFIRMWTYYLCYCEAAFDEQCIGLLQVQFDKPESRRALSRQGMIRSQLDSANACRPSVSDCRALGH